MYLINIWNRVQLTYFDPKFFFSLRIPSSSAISELTCLSNHTIGWDKFKIIATYQRYYQHLCLEAWHINSTDAPLNRGDVGLLPDAHLHLVTKKAAC